MGTTSLSAEVCYMKHRIVTHPIHIYKCIYTDLSACICIYTLVHWICVPMTRSTSEMVLAARIDILECQAAGCRPRWTLALLPFAYYPIALLPYCPVSLSPYRAAAWWLLQVVPKVGPKVGPGMARSWARSWAQSCPQPCPQPSPQSEILGHKYAFRTQSLAQSLAQSWARSWAQSCPQSCPQVATEGTNKVTKHV